MPNHFGQYSQHSSILKVLMASSQSYFKCQICRYESPRALCFHLRRKNSQCALANDCNGWRWILLCWIDISSISSITSKTISSRPFRSKRGVLPSSAIQQEQSVQVMQLFCIGWWWWSDGGVMQKWWWLQWLIQWYWKWYNLCIRNIILTLMMTFMILSDEIIPKYLIRHIQFPDPNLRKNL